MTGKFVRAAEMYTKAVSVAREIHSPDMAADARIGLALSLRAQCMWRQAWKLIKMSKKRYATNQDNHGLAFALWAEAGTLRIKGDVPGAVKTFRESLKLFASMKDDNGIGYCLCGLGGASRVAGHIKASLNFYTAANTLFTKLRDSFGKAYSFCGIANAYRMLGDYAKAFSFFAKATRLYRTIGDKVSYAYTLWGLGTAYKMTGRYEKARDCMKKAMRYFRATKDPRGMIYCRLGLGEIAFLKGDSSRAEKHLVSVRKSLSELRLRIEDCYANSLHRMMKSQSSVTAARTQTAKRGKKKNVSRASCYHRLGLNLRFHSLPLNFP